MKKLFLLFAVSFILVGCGKKNNTYENKALYELREHFCWKDTYKKVTIPVAINNKVPSEFCMEKTYYTEKEASSAVTVKEVLVKQWRVIEKRREEMLNKFFIFFLSIAACGFIGLLAGLFCMYKGIMLWDELIVGGGLSFAFGLASAWYCDYLPVICTTLVICILGMAVYMLISRRKAQKKDTQKTEAIKDVMVTVEYLKTHSRDKWNDIKGKLENSKSTENFISELKSEVMEIVTKDTLKKIHKSQ